MIETAQKYIDAGYAVVPCGKNKAPVVSGSIVNRIFTADDFNGVDFIGIICGEKSQWVECLDFDNHFNDAKENLKRFHDEPEIKPLFDKYKFLCEKTQNGGYHVVYKCSNDNTSKKLAERWNPNATPSPRPEPLIETRGGGNYFVCDPSPGYKLLTGDLLNIPEITAEDHYTLMSVARSFNEFKKASNTQYENPDLPGNIYNSDPKSIDEAKALLKEAGWTEKGAYNWCRPGKKTGTSATFGKVAENVFYVFSSSAYPFDNERAYTPFQILALLKFSGDYSEAAKSLPKSEQKHSVKKEWVEKKNKELDEDTMQKFLTGAFIDTTKKVEHPPVILSLFEEEASRYIEKRLFTLGNFSCVIGKAKSKKTFFMTMVTAALLKNGLLQDSMKGNLGDEKRRILYFDTEQGEFDSHNTIRRIITLAETSQNLYAFNLRPFSPMERCQLIEYAFKHWGNEVGFCVIDGIADLANAINEEDEATRVTTMLLRLTKTYNCHISTVIHQNKNDNFATGHLGSSIMKKAEIIISVTRDVTDKRRSLVSCDMSRSVDFSDFAFDIDYNGYPEIKRVQKQTVPNFYYDKTEKEDTPF